MRENLAYTRTSFIVLLVISAVLQSWPMQQRLCAAAQSSSAGVLQGFWPLNEGEGEVVRDAAGRLPGLLRILEKGRGPEWINTEGRSELSFPGGKNGGFVEVQGGGEIVWGERFSIKLDMSPEEENVSGVLLASRHASSKKGGFLLYYWAAKRQLIFSFADGVAIHTCKATLPRKIQAGTWETIEVTYDGKELCSKAGSRIIAERKLPGLSMRKSASPLVIGGYYNDMSSGFRGRIRNVALLVPHAGPEAYQPLETRPSQRFVRGLKTLKKNLSDMLLPEESPALYAYDDYILVANNVVVPNWFRLGAPPGKIKRLRPVYYLDVPEGINLLWAGSDPIGRGRHIGAAVYRVKKGNPVEHNGAPYQRFEIMFDMVHPAQKSFGPVYFTSTLPDESESVLYYGATWRGGSQDAQKLQLITRRFPEPGPPRRLHTSVGWMLATNGMAWPGFFEAYSRLGFNAVALNGLYERGIKRDLVAYAAKVRAKGLKLVYNDSPFHRIRRARETDSLISGVSAPGDICPAYRGRLYLEEIERVADMVQLLKPDFAFWDIECFKRGAYAGLTKQCQRCNDYVVRSGKGTREAMVSLGTSVAHDMHQAIKHKTSSVPLTGMYNTRTRFAYQDIFDFDHMYKNGVDFAQPAFYDCLKRKEMGISLRSMRTIQQNGKIIPWLHPGTIRDYPSPWMYDGVLEVFGSGLMGLSWCGFRDMEAEDFYYFALAMQAVKPVEEVLAGGEPLNGITSGNPRVAVSGICTDTECVLLLSDYSSRPFTGLVSVFFPHVLPGNIWDLAQMKRVASAGSKVVEFYFGPGAKGAHTALFYVGERSFKQRLQ